MQGRSRGGRAGWRRRGLSPGNPPGPRVGCEAPPGRAGPGLWGRPVRGDCSNRSNCPPPPLPARVRGVAHGKEGLPEGSEPRGRGWSRGGGCADAGRDVAPRTGALVAAARPALPRLPRAPSAGRAVGRLGFPALGASPRWGRRRKRPT